MSLKEEIVQKLKEIKPILHEKYAITYLGVFGSVMRGEEKADSDIDILVDFDWDRQNMAGFALLRLIDDLEAKLGKKVDLVTRGGLHPILGPYILSEAEEIIL